MGQLPLDGCAAAVDVERHAIDALIDRGALFVTNSSAKDSQAMYLELRDRVPAAQLVLVDADLGEWNGSVQMGLGGKTPRVARASSLQKDPTERRSGFAREDLGIAHSVAWWCT